MPIEVIFLEAGRQTPAEIAARLAQFLAAAHSTLHLAVYDFHLGDAVAAPILQVLRERAAAGVDIRVIYDAGKPAAPWNICGAGPSSPATGRFLQSVGAGVRCKAITGGDPRLPKLMHHKYVIRDGRMGSGAVWTGSTNFTEDSWSLEENNIVLLDSTELCAYFETDFEELWTRGDIATTGAHDTGKVRVGDTPVTVAFAPGEGRTIDHDVARRIGAARRRLKVCSVILTSGTILGAMADVLNHGRVAEYGGIYDRTQMEGVKAQWRGTPAEWKVAAFDRIAVPLAGKRSTPYAPGTPHDFMHNKILLCDDTVVTGSFNFSHSATENAENVLFITEPDLAGRYNAYIDQLASRYRDAT